MWQPLAFVQRSIDGHLSEPYPLINRLTHGSVSTEDEFMKQPTPSDFLVEVKEAYVSVFFKPSESYYSFGRLADPEDIARYGPLSQSPNARHTKTDDTGDYPSEEVAQMAHTLAVKAVTGP